jgi:hypothetical protein
MFNAVSPFNLPNLFGGLFCKSRKWTFTGASPDIIELFDIQHTVSSNWVLYIIVTKQADHRIVGYIEFSHAINLQKIKKIFNSEKSEKLSFLVFTGEILPLLHHIKTSGQILVEDGVLLPLFIS